MTTPPEVAHDPDHEVLVVLQCSKSKQDGRLPAREKYAHPRANLFKKSREYVETLGLDYIILSGKYGALQPGNPIDDYNTSVRDRDNAEWRQDVLDALDERNIDLDEYDELRLLVGKTYQSPLADVFDRVDADVTTPLDGCEGYGYMVGRISDWIDDLDAEDDTHDRRGGVHVSTGGP